MTDTREDNLQQIGKNALASIREMVAALECDYERLEELRDARDAFEFDEDANAAPDGPGYANNAEAWASENADEADELADLEAATGDCKDRDDAETRIQEDPLSIEYRTRWMESRETVERDDWAEACILLTAGGPAVRIMVELRDGEPHRAYLQVQDWGTPWTDYYEEGIGELLMSYVNVFCFE